MQPNDARYEVVKVAPGDDRYAVTNGSGWEHSHMDHIYTIGTRSQVLSDFRFASRETMEKKIDTADIFGSSSGRMMWDSPYFIIYTTIDAADSGKFGVDDTYAVTRDQLRLIADAVDADRPYREFDVEISLENAVARHSRRAGGFIQVTHWHDVALDSVRAGVSWDLVTLVSEPESSYRAIGSRTNPLLRVLVQAAVTLTRTELGCDRRDGGVRQCTHFGDSDSNNLTLLADWVKALSLLVQDYDGLFYDEHPSSQMPSDGVSADDGVMVVFIVDKFTPLLGKVKPSEVVSMYTNLLDTSEGITHFGAYGWRGTAPMLIDAALGTASGATVDVEAIEMYLRVGVDPSIVVDALENGIDVDMALELSHKLVDEG